MKRQFHVKIEILNKKLEFKVSRKTEVGYFH